MAIAVAMFGLAFAAFCFWLGVRIANRREKWAKRTAVALAAVLVYPLSFGPACWTTSWFNRGAEAVSVIYQPLTWTMSRSNVIAISLVPYSELMAAPDWRWVFITPDEGATEARWMPFLLTTGMPSGPDEMAPAPMPPDQ